MEQNRIIDQLDDLTEVFIISEEMFRQATEHAKNAELKNLLEGERMKLGAITRELQAEVEHLGGTPKSQGTIAGSMPDMWNSLANLFKTGDQNILAQLEENEDRLVLNFRRILDEPLPVDMKKFLRLRYVQLVNSHDLIRKLRNNYKSEAKTA
jgi:uncharacterized protein (TIGR02284 family)